MAGTNLGSLYLWRLPLDGTEDEEELSSSSSSSNLLALVHSTSHPIAQVAIALSRTKQEDASDVQDCSHRVLLAASDTVGVVRTHSGSHLSSNVVSFDLVNEANFPSPVVSCVFQPQLHLSAVLPFECGEKEEREKEQGQESGSNALLVCCLDGALKLYSEEIFTTLVSSASKVPASTDPLPALPEDLDHRFSNNMILPPSGNLVKGDILTHGTEDAGEELDEGNNCIKNDVEVEEERGSGRIFEDDDFISSQAAENKDSRGSTSVEVLEPRQGPPPLPSAPPIPSSAGDSHEGEKRKSIAKACTRARVQNNVDLRCYPTAELAHASLQTSNALRSKAAYLETKIAVAVEGRKMDMGRGLEDDVSLVSSTPSERVEAATKVVTKSGKGRRYEANELIELSESAIEGQIRTKQSIAKQVDPDWLARRQYQGPSEEHRELLRTASPHVVVSMVSSKPSIPAEKRQSSSGFRMEISKETLQPVFYQDLHVDEVFGSLNDLVFAEGVEEGKQRYTEVCKETIQKFGGPSFLWV